MPSAEEFRFLLDVIIGKVTTWKRTRAKNGRKTLSYFMRLERRAENEGAGGENILSRGKMNCLIIHSSNF